MKNKLFKLIAGLGVFAFAFTVNAEVTDSTTINVAEGQTSSNATATVGTVETPVYEVVVIWNDLTFNWVYDSETNDFGWAPVPICYGIDPTEENVQDALDRGEKVFTDRACESRTYNYNSETAEYYILDERKSTSIGIEDISQNGQIIPSISWKADTKYADVNANFTYTGEGCTLIPTEAAFNYVKSEGKTLYNSNTCETTVNSEGFIKNSYYVIANTTLPLASGEDIPDTGRQSAAGTMGVDGITFPLKDFTRNQYYVQLALDGGETTPTTGDTIGTITVSIKTK